MNTDPKEPLEENKDNLPFDWEESKVNSDDWEDDMATLYDDDLEEDDEEIEDRSTDEWKHYVADLRMDAERDDRMIKD